MATSKETDVDSTADTEIGTSSRSSTNLMIEDIMQKRNTNRTEKEKAVVEGLKKVESRFRLVPGSSTAVGSAAGASRSITSVSQSTLGSQNSGAMSTAAKQAMDHMNRVFKCDSREDERGFLKYVEKVNMIPIHRLSTAELESCQIGKEEWALIKLAADMSKQAYEDEMKIDPGIVVHNFLRSDPDMKPTLIATLTHGKKKTLIVAIRGTVTTDDWLLNFNGNPVTSKHLDETFQWHQGFLRVTLDKMQDHIARCVEGITTRVQGLEQIIFTGHSAGGAVAQILYALSMRASSTIARAIRGFASVHCVTFAAPPVSQPPISPPDPISNAAHSQGHFLAVINEGDPVPLAQEAYILKLLDVYSKTIPKLQEEGLDQFVVPHPVMKLSGDCILLRDENPEDPNSFNIRAYSAKAEVLQNKLFGNPLEHFMIEYQARIYKVLELESSRDKEMEIDL